jgi:hypothetical protein
VHRLSRFRFGQTTPYYPRCVAHQFLPDTEKLPYSPRSIQQGLKPAFAVILKCPDSTPALSQKRLDPTIPEKPAFAFATSYT